MDVISYFCATFKLNNWLLESIEPKWHDLGVQTETGRFSVLSVALSGVQIYISENETYSGAGIGTNIF